MPKTYVVEVNIRENGRLLPGFPVRRRLICEEAQHSMYLKAPDPTDADFTPLPVQELTAVRLLFFSAPDQPLNVRIANPGGFGAAVVQLEENGFLLMMNGILTAVHLSLNNFSGFEATPEVLACGN